MLVLQCHKKMYTTIARIIKGDVFQKKVEEMVWKDWVEGQKEPDDMLC